MPLDNPRDNSPEVKGNKKVINAWAMYDWANSAHALVIVSAIFPIYYAKMAEHHDTVSFVGKEFKSDSLFSYAVSFAYLFVALFSPMLSSIADYSGRKKSFMIFFCTLGALSCAGLYFFDSFDHLWIGIDCFILSVVGYSGSIVFYNAFLPEIAYPEQQDKVSAKGFAYGYVGSSLLLIFNLIMIQKPELFGITDASFPARFSFLLVGLWWLGFAQITFYYLPSNPTNLKPVGNFLLNGYKELQVVWKILKGTGNLKKFLIAFFFYNAGVQTVMYVAALFGSYELKLDTGILITTILIIQFVAMAGALFFAWLSGKFGNIKAISIAIMIWIAVCVGAYFVTEKNGFMILAAFVGMVMGGIQSLSRSTYSKMLPETKDHASFFSFYDVCDKIGIVLGTAGFGFVIEVTGSMRNSILWLIGFFIIGLILLLRIRTKNDKLIPV